MDTTPTLTIVRSARKGAATDHLAFNTGWSSVPLCGAMKTGKRVFPGGDSNCTPCIAEANRQYLDIEGLVRISPRVRDLIAAVRAHAIEHYDTGAWDIIVEAYSDSELAGTVGKCRTAAGAIAKVGKIVGQYAGRRAPHDAEIAAATEPVRCTATDECEECESGSVCVARCTHCGGTNSTPCPRHDAPAGEPDGSVVSCRYYPDGELMSATRTWPGKVGSASITVEWCGEGDAPETYYPGWCGQTIKSANFCDFDASVPF